PCPAEAVPMAAVPESPVPLAGSAETISGNASLGSLGSAETLAPSAVIAPVAEAVPVAPARPDAPLMAEDGPALPGVPIAPEDLDRVPSGTQPKLIVLRGLKINAEYPLYEGHNFIGRFADKPVVIDLEDQEPPDRILSSRQHAVITFEDGRLVIEDLNSSNGTYVNRTRVHPGQQRPLKIGDVMQIGTVQLKVKV